MSRRLNTHYLFRPIGRVEVDESGRKCAMVGIYPDLELKEGEQMFSEIIFLVDRY